MVEDDRGVRRAHVVHLLIQRRRVMKGKEEAHKVFERRLGRVKLEMGDKNMICHLIKQ